jgi:hypothetical protein
MASANLSEISEASETKEDLPTIPAPTSTTTTTVPTGIVMDFLDTKIKVSDTVATSLAAKYATLRVTPGDMDLSFLEAQKALLAKGFKVKIELSSE